MKRRHLLATAIPTILLAASAYGLRAPSYLHERTFEVATGARAHTFAQRSYVAPQPATAEWNNFLASHGAWTATWNADTGVASMITGEGIAAPNAVADAPSAESAARIALAEQMALLAPGSSIDDFTVLSNVVRHDIRVVRFTQHYQGLAVVNAQVAFVFEHDRLVAMSSSAMPRVDAAIPSSLVAQSVASDKAVQWVGGIYQSTPNAISVGDAKILPLQRDGKAGIEYRTVVPVIVDQDSPRAQWDVYVDAATGEPIARHQRLLFASGTMTFHVPARYPQAGYVDKPAPFVNVTAGNQSTTADQNGLVNFNGSSTTVVPSVSGQYVNVSNYQASVIAGPQLTMNDGQPTVWDASSDDFSDAQLDAYINANTAKQFARDHYDPNLAWLGGVIPVTVNEIGNPQIGQYCNAYSKLDDIHFFRAGNEQGTNCTNTGRITDVLYHEFGHSLHAQTRGDGTTGMDDGSLSEGVADFNAANMIEDPNLGLGFFADQLTTPLRSADPVGMEYKWPDDSTSGANNQFGDNHWAGQIISGALWDLRKAAIISMGDTQGRAYVDKIYIGILAVADDIPGTYQAALIADDNDGDLSNGTPNQCMIQNAFAPHGLGDAASLAVIAPPTTDGLTVTLAQPTGNAACPPPQIASGTVTWRLRSDNSQTGTVPLTVSGSSLTATLPAQANGEVIEYQVSATTDAGSTQNFPLNPADQWYAMYAGGSTPIYSTDFESTDPTTDGWTLGTGWAWGSPAPSGQTDDPHAAFSGSKEIGINLSGDYDPGAVYDATSKTIDVSQFAGDKIHLQFRRWLGVEDATYDHATIKINGTVVWTNATGGGSLEFEDNEWRFTDIDVSQYATGGTIQVGFHLDSDPGLQFGGWNVDDFRLIAVTANTCGNGTVETGEECDDGNTVDGDGCSASCLSETGGDDTGGGSGGCCSTSGGGAAGSIVLGLFVGGLVVTRRRRRA